MWNTAWMRSVEWLAAAAIDPRDCKRQWDHGTGTALLEAGRYWNVLSVPEELGLHALNVLWYDPLRTPGPVLRHSKARRVGFFLPPGPDQQWIGAGIRHVGKGSWIPVPPPYRDTGHLEWIIPPDGRGTLHSPDRLEAALHTATSTLPLPETDPHEARTDSTIRCGTIT
ncbi:hypothetical protein NFX46_17850 [Streptomyces phaeoluteigriseus]|uniref:DNA primase/polymerase bifunctional N-terminal domain-containing protein n=1 Tax=Streptomyces phaeoluteigriseus TaxID=114686 RepID=A0ABY4Z8V7_9ACTN|nr:hypothetical protein [Streptomyces phaeoluteigriseus]USQ85479.1 hypothetical protein NFX46_17850 [Streptomyces phaeoluteigriseus]